MSDATRSNTLCVVPCGKAKVWSREPTRGPTPARLVYIGSFASAARVYAEQFHPDAWVILSAKHGFLLPDDVVPESYEVTFKRKRDPALVSLDTLREQIAAKKLDRFSMVVVVAGREYEERVRAAFAGSSVRIETPLVGLPGMGAMLSKMKAARDRGAPLV